MLGPLLSEDAFIMPCKGILRFCAMSLPVSPSCIYHFVCLGSVTFTSAKIGLSLLQDLWRSRHSLKDVEGFDHAVVNDTVGACGDLPGQKQGPCLPYYVWQCGYTKVKSLAHFKRTTNFVSLKSN